MSNVNWLKLVIHWLLLIILKNKVEIHLQDTDLYTIGCTYKILILWYTIGRH